MKLSSIVLPVCLMVALYLQPDVSWSQENRRPLIPSGIPLVPADTLADDFDLPSIRKKLRMQDAVSPDNPLTEQRVALGRKLFFDPVLSKDGSVSCASCHQPEHGFASPDAKAIGIGGQAGRRNAPTLWNRAFGKVQFWDGRVVTLEQQALQPIGNPKELGHSVESVLETLRRKPDYVQLFSDAFKGKAQHAQTTTTQLVTAENLAKSLAAFQRTLIKDDSPVDRFQGGMYDALSDDERQGLWIFESRGRCWKCHSGDHYSDESFHSTGVGYGLAIRDTGRFEVTRLESDRGKFKTPTLRAIASTAPYMHDGSLKTLAEVVAFYNDGGHGDDPNLDPDIKPLGLSDREMEQLVAFLKAL